MAVHHLVVLVICCVTAVQSRPGVDVKIAGPGKLEATEGELPYLAVILDKKTRLLVTSGVLVKSNIVLTLAYNFYILNSYAPSDIVVVLGTHNRSLDEPSRQEYNATDIVFHPEFISTADGVATGDLSLIRLEENAELNDRVQVFPLKDINSNSKLDNKLVRNGDCVTAGYGLIKWNEYETIYPRTMQKYSPQMQTGKTCEDYISDTYGTGYLKKRWMCSLNDDLTETKQGDGGNPLVCIYNDGEPTLFGLVAGGGTTYELTGLTVYVRISTYRDWIVDTARELS